jgi:hypothetical protein
VRQWTREMGGKRTQWSYTYEADGRLTELVKDGEIAYG